MNEEELKAALEKLQEENDRLNIKLGEANKHAKAAEKLAADREREKQEANGNWEQLYKDSESKRIAFEEEMKQVKLANEAKDIRASAMQVAGMVAEGANAEILARFAKDRLKMVDGCVKVTDEQGNLTVSSLSDLAKEFSASDRFSSLVKGSQSSGGGAAGNANSNNSSGRTTIKRADFDALGPVEKQAMALELRKSGGRIED